MITKFDSLYAGHVDMDDIGYGGTAVSTVVDVYEKPGKRGGSMNFAVIETEYRNQGEMLVARARSVTIETGQVVKD